jgi:hypothetical protein
MSVSLDTPADDERHLDLPADRLADRLAARLSLATGRPEALIDASEVARITGKTRAWVYDHAGDLGAVRLGSGRRPRLGCHRPASCSSSQPRRRVYSHHSSIVSRDARPSRRRSAIPVSSSSDTARASLISSVRRTSRYRSTQRRSRGSDRLRACSSATDAARGRSGAIGRFMAIIIARSPDAPLHKATPPRGVFECS